MPDEPVHSLIQAIDDNEPEVTEYWLADDEITLLMDDWQAGRIDEATYLTKCRAWEQRWREKLARFDAGSPSLELPPQHDTPATKTADLRPQKSAGISRGPKR